MDTAGKKPGETMYFRCRKEAAMHNDRLASRAGAAELLGISESSLAKHELGITKFVPVDLVAMMADLYGCPELKANYCKNECPLGRDLTIATEIAPIERVTLSILPRPVSLHGGAGRHTIRGRLYGALRDGVHINGGDRLFLDGAL